MTVKRVGGFVTTTDVSKGQMNQTGCALKYYTEQNIWKTQNGYGFATNRPYLGYGYNAFNTVQNNDDGTSSYVQNILHNADLGYKLALGTIKDNKHYEKGAKFTTEFDVHGGVSYANNDKITNPMFNYGGSLTLKHEDAVAGPGFMRGLSLTCEASTSHQGTIKVDGLSAAPLIPDKISQTDVKANMGFKGNMYPYADVCVKAGGGWEFTSTEINKVKTKDNRPFVDVTAGVRILAPIQNSTCTPEITVEGYYRHQFANPFDKETIMNGNPDSFGVRVTISPSN